MTARRPRPDALAVLLLVALWLLFFWRLFTPIQGDQASLTRGDFSGQFVAFGDYQYARFAQGEIPLWNPFNNGGLPFIADTQAAVFYPPRIITLGLSKIAGGWTYHALELEMTAHVLLYSLLMYALVRHMTRGEPGSIVGALCAALVAGYGGFTSGYPPLQLALLEAAIWLPLAVLGIFEATRPANIQWRWLVVAGFALGMSWLAGHPQTSYFLTLLMLAFYAYRCFVRRAPVRLWLGGAALFGLVAFGMAAVQLLPGIEYLGHTARAGFEFDAKGNGFPIQDIIQFVYPGIVSLFSPLYVGVTGFMLALIAVWHKAPGARFWGLAALVALLWSFGANSALYPLLYNMLPGLRFFRGQERAAFLVVNSLAILAGLGVARLASWDILRYYGAVLRLRVSLNRLFTLVLAFAALVVVAWLGNPAAYGSIVPTIALSTVVVGALSVLIPWGLAHDTTRRWLALLVVLLAFELFTINMDADAVYDPVPPSQQVSMTPPALVQPVIDDADAPFRVDGFRGLTDNYGSLYQVMDMRGISPLFLSAPFALIEPDHINPRAWELFAVRYVYTDWQELPVPSEIIATGEDRYGALNLHRLSDPRSFAQLMYVEPIVIPDTAEALRVVREPSFDPRHQLVLDQPLTLEMPDDPPENASAVVRTFAPEAFKIELDTPENAVLSVAHVHYPGWRATMDGEPVDILRAYGALSAVEVPAGTHTINFVYDPLSYRIGAIVSLVTWGALVIVLAVTIGGRTQRNRMQP